MKYVFFLFFFFCARTIAYPQALLQDPVSNRYFNTDKYSGTKGSPFLYDKWITGSVTTPKGIYNSIKLKLDLFDNSLLFFHDEQVLEFQDDVLSFILKPNPTDSGSFRHFMKGISEAGIKPAMFVEVLSDGPASLYKSEVRSVTEVSEVNAGVIKTFMPVTRYYLKIHNGVQMINPVKDLVNKLQDQSEKVKRYISESGLKLKKERDMVDLVNYYNQL